MEGERERGEGDGVPPSQGREAGHPSLSVVTILHSQAQVAEFVQRKTYDMQYLERLYTA